MVERVTRLHQVHPSNTSEGSASERTSRQRTGGAYTPPPVNQREPRLVTVQQLEAHFGRIQDAVRMAASETQRDVTASAQVAIRELRSETNDLHRALVAAHILDQERQAK